MRTCKYKYCDNSITACNLRIKYCCVLHRDKQHRLNSTERYFIKEKRKIEERKKVIIKSIPTIITPQASRYQDLLRYSTTVMSNFEQAQSSRQV